jgi:caa(3)-type oxidase subunit IV
MTTSKTLLRDHVSLVWLGLMSLTLVSWALGGWRGSGGNHAVASVIILCVAVFKARLVGLYFMELRDAPWWLRGIFETYCAALLAVLISLYLFS